MNKNQSTGYTKSISESRERKYLKQLQKQKECDDVQQIAVKEQTILDQGVHRGNVAR